MNSHVRYKSSEYYVKINMVGGEGVNETGRAQGSREKRKAQPAGPVWPGVLVAGACDSVSEPP